MTTVIDALVLELGLDGSKFKTGADQANQQIRQVEQQATRSASEIERRGGQAAEFFNGLKRAALGFATVLAGIGIERFVSQVAGLSSGLKNMAYGLDMNVRDLSAWQNAVVHIANGTAEGVTSSFAAMQNELQQLRFTGKSDLLPLFRFLGISPSDANGNQKTPAALFEEIGDKLQGRDPAQAKYLMQQAHLDDGLINFLLKPKGERDAELKRQREHTAMTTENVNALNDLNVAARGLMIDFENFSTNLTVKAVPSLLEFIGLLDDVVAVAAGNMSVADFTAKHLHKPWALMTDDEVKAYNAAHPNQTPMPLHGAGTPSVDDFGRPIGTDNNIGPVADNKVPTAQRIQSQLMAQGWSADQAAGIIGNLDRESGFDPRNVGDGGLAYGIGQWHPDRQADFKAWAGKDIRQSTLEEQVAFLNYELTQGKEKDAGNRLRAATSPQEAADLVSQYYERPRDPYGAERMARSISADQWRRKLTNQPSAPVATAGDLPPATTNVLDQLRRAGTPTATGNGGSTNTTSVTVGSVTVNTNATDAHGVAAAFASKVKSLTAQANSGLA